jgi:hypothetical protein
MPIKFTMIIEYCEFMGDYHSKLNTLSSYWWKDGDTTWKVSQGLESKTSILCAKSYANPFFFFNKKNSTKPTQEHSKPNMVYNRIEILDENSNHMDTTKICNGDLIAIRNNLRYYKNTVNRITDHDMSFQLVGIKLLMHALEVEEENI